jgi:hypothetical protein
MVWYFTGVFFFSEWLAMATFFTFENNVLGDVSNLARWSTKILHPKKQVILRFKICPKKQVTLPYLESACACTNQLLPSIGNK